MPASDAWARYLRFLRRDRAADVEEEVAFHLDMRRRELEARGWTPEAARAEASRIFGDVANVTTECLTIDARRDRRQTRQEDRLNLLRDVRLAARSLRRAPAFTVAALLCFALGVAATTTIASAIYGVLLRPLPYPRAHELVAIYGAKADRDIRGANISFADYESWRDETRAFSAMGIWTWTSYTLSGDGEGDAERVDGAGVSPELFSLLGVRPMLGRTFVAAEHPRSDARVIILGHALWRRRYGGDSTIVGRVITVDRLPYTVVGVMPPGFAFPDRGQAWTPFGLAAWGGDRQNRGYAGAIARLRRDATFDEGSADLAVISQRLQQEYPRENEGWVADPLPLREDLVGELRRPLLVFLAAVALVLLIACANVANLMLARGATRQREMAVRTALGAGRSRLVRLVLIESVVLALAGGAIGALLSYQGVRALRFAFPDGLPFYVALDVDVKTLLFVILLSLAVGVLAGLLPALRSTAVNVARSLREGGRGDLGDSRGARTRNALVVFEVALAVVVLVSALLLVRSYHALANTELGFATSDVLTARVSLPGRVYESFEQRRHFWERLFARIAANPAVEHVGSAQGVPFSGWNVQSQFSVEGAPARRFGEELVAHYQWVSPEYFTAIGVPLVRGRFFDARDRDSSVHHVLINEILARREFPGQDPIGKRLKQGDVDSPDPWLTVVGVVGEFRHYQLPEPMGPAIYFPMFAWPSTTQTVAINTRDADPYAVAEHFTDALRALDPAVPAYQVRSLEDVVARSLWSQRLQGRVLAIFAVLALLLASAGIYGVMSYAVAQRRREIGVRIALGATRARVATSVVAQAARLALLGILVGVAVALAFSRAVQALLYAVQPRDPITFVAAPAALALAAVLAALLPALRAVRIDPATAMRAE